MLGYINIILRNQLQGCPSDGCLFGKSGISPFFDFCSPEEFYLEHSEISYARKRVRPKYLHSYVLL